MKAITVKVNGTAVVIGLINGTVGGKNNIFPLYKIFHDPLSAEVMKALDITADVFRYVEIGNSNYDGNHIDTKLPVMPLDFFKQRLETSNLTLEEVPVMYEGALADFGDLEVDDDIESLKESVTIEGLSPDEVCEICKGVNNLLFAAAVFKSSDEYKAQYSDQIINWVLSDCSYLYDAVWPEEFKQHTKLLNSPERAVSVRESETAPVTFSIAPLKLILMEQLVSIDKATNDNTSHFDGDVVSLLSTAPFILPDIETSDDESDDEILKLQAIAGADFSLISGQNMDGSPVINSQVIPVQEKITPFSDVYPFTNIPDEAFYGEYTASDILGHPECNSSFEFEPKEYEKLVHEKLKQMCIAEIIITTGIFNPDEVIDKNLPTACNEYIQILITQAMVKNYMFSGIVSSIGTSEAAEDDDDEGTTVESVLPFRLGTIETIGEIVSTPNDFRLNPKFEPDTDIKIVENYVDQIPNLGLGTSSLFNYLKSSTTCPWAFVDALVQLIRYGKEKPTCLAITGAKSNNKNVYWDIINCCATHFNGNVSTLIKKCPEGSDTNIFVDHFCAVKSSNLSTDFRDKFKEEFSLITRDIPEALVVGAILREEYLDEECKELNFYKFFDIFALHDAVENGLKLNSFSPEEIDQTDVSILEFDKAIDYIAVNGITVTPPCKEITSIMLANNYKKKNLNLLSIIADICNTNPGYAEYILTSAIKVKNNEVATFSKSVAELAILYQMLPKVVALNLQGTPSAMFQYIPMLPSIFSTIQFSKDLDSIFMTRPESKGAYIIPLENNGQNIGYTAHLKLGSIYYMFMFTPNEFEEYKKKFSKQHNIPIADIFTNLKPPSTLDGSLLGIRNKDYRFAIAEIEKASKFAMKQSAAVYKFVGATKDTIDYFKQY